MTMRRPWVHVLLTVVADACQFPGLRRVEPLVPLSPAAPVHPNALGMQGMAAILEAAVAA